MRDKYKIIHSSKDDYIIQRFINKQLGYTVISIKKTLPEAMNYIPENAEVIIS